MATFVLVHGGWHGAWCWERLIPLLQAAGHRVFAPTMTGFAERANLLTPEVGISTHIQDIVQVIENHNLEKVILLGHSYGGMIITGVVDRVPDCIAHLVYLDTFVPKDGESMADIVPNNVRGLRKEALAHGDGWRVAPLHAMPFGIEEVFGVSQEPDLSWVKSMVTPQSLKTFEERLHLRNPDIVSSKPRTHIYCTGGGTFLNRTFFNIMRRTLMRRTLAPAGPGWRLRQLPTGHDCMITMPRELAGLLLEIAEI